MLAVVDVVSNPGLVSGGGPERPIAVMFSNYQRRKRKKNVKEKDKLPGRYYFSDVSSTL